MSCRAAELAIDRSEEDCGKATGKEVGAIALLLALAAGKWQGLVVSGLGVGALLSAKRCQSLRARENLIILTLILLVASTIAVRWTMD